MPESVSILGWGSVELMGFDGRGIWMEKREMAWSRQRALKFILVGNRVELETLHRPD